MNTNCQALYANCANGRELSFVRRNSRPLAKFASKIPHSTLRTAFLLIRVPSCVFVVSSPYGEAQIQTDRRLRWDELRRLAGAENRPGGPAEGRRGAGEPVPQPAARAQFEPHGRWRACARHDRPCRGPQSRIQNAGPQARPRVECLVAGRHPRDDGNALPRGVSRPIRRDEQAISLLCMEPRGHESLVATSGVACDGDAERGETFLWPTRFQIVCRHPEL